MSKLNKYLERVQNQKNEQPYLEAGLSRIFDHNKNFGIAMLSAWASPNNEKFKKEDGTIDELKLRQHNNSAVKKIRRLFENQGIAHIRTVGQYGNFEHSEFVPFIPPEQRTGEYEKWGAKRTPETWKEFKRKIIEIASDKDIDQESILFKDPDSEEGYLYFCKDSSNGEHLQRDTIPVGSLHFSSLAELNRDYYDLRKKAEEDGKDPDKIDKPDYYSQLRHGNKEAVFRYKGDFSEEAVSKIVLPSPQELFDDCSGFARLARHLEDDNRLYGPTTLRRRGLVEKIKDYLVDESESESESWKDFVDQQEIGDCQHIVALIKHKFPQVTKIVGEIKTSEPYTDGDERRQKFMIHHWVEIDRIYYDFAKGTIQNYVDMDKYDLYEPEVLDDEIYKAKIKNS